MCTAYKRQQPNYRRETHVRHRWRAIIIIIY